MINRGKISFNNPMIDTMIQSGHPNQDMKHRASDDRGWGLSIIGGYLDSLFEIMTDSMISKQWIDLTYDNIERLPPVLMILYTFQSKVGYAHEKNVELIGKTLAAVMYGLAINEHNCDLRIVRGKKAPMWADMFNIYLEGKPDIDFLEPALQTIRPLPFGMTKGLMMDLKPIIESYKVVIGIDLAQHGLK